MRVLIGIEITVVWNQYIKMYCWTQCVKAMHKNVLLCQYVVCVLKAMREYVNLNCMYEGISFACVMLETVSVWDFCCWNLRSSALNCARPKPVGDILWPPRFQARAICGDPRNPYDLKEKFRVMNLERIAFCCCITVHFRVEATVGLSCCCTIVSFCWSYCIVALLLILVVSPFTSVMKLL